MIKIHANDNIFDIIYKIKKSNTEKKIVLEIPFGHPVLHNYLALKSLVNKFLNKKIIISTSDIASKKIGKSLGIKYSHIKNRGFISDEQNILKYNYSFFEYFKYEMKKYLNKLRYIFNKNKKIEKTKSYYKKFNTQKPNIVLFLSLFMITISIFLYIFYFALNKTYIYITPNKIVQTKSLNFLFTENKSKKILGDREEQLLKIEKIINLEKDFNTTGIKQDEKLRSSGTIRFINNYPEEIKLKPATRLETKDGILYETLNWVVVPGSKKNITGKIIPGMKEAKIRSKLKDNKGVFIGIRGNLSQSGANLSIPGLKNTDISMYAKTISPIIGGTNAHTSIVAEEDKKNAEKLIIEKLKKLSLEEIYKEIDKKNEANNVTFKILGVEDVYKFKNIKVDFLSDLVPGEELNSFKVKGSIEVYSFAYNIDSVISKLKSEIDASIIAEKEKIFLINDSSIRVSNVLYRNESPFNIKATIEIEVTLSYNFKDEGDNYTHRLKQTVSGLNKDEAERMLINERKISNVSIDIRPFFIKKISSFLNNIKFIVEE